MVPKTKAAKMFYEFYSDPDGNELPGNGYKLEKKPPLF